MTAESAQVIKKCSNVTRPFPLQRVWGLEMKLVFLSLVCWVCVFNKCDQLQENPAYGIHTELVQCALLVLQVSIYQYSDTTDLQNKDVPVVLHIQQEN